MKSIDRVEKTNVVVKRSSKHLANKNSKKKKERDSWNNNKYLSSLNYRGTKIGGFLRRTIGEEEERNKGNGRAFGWHKRFRYQLALAAKPIHPYYNAERY